MVVEQSRNGPVVMKLWVDPHGYQSDTPSPQETSSCLRIFRWVNLSRNDTSWSFKKSCRKDPSIDLPSFFATQIIFFPTISLSRGSPTLLYSQIVSIEDNLWFIVWIIPKCGVDGLLSAVSKFFLLSIDARCGGRNANEQSKDRIGDLRYEMGW